MGSAALGAPQSPPWSPPMEKPAAKGGLNRATQRVPGRLKHRCVVARCLSFPSCTAPLGQPAAAAPLYVMDTGKGAGGG